MDLKRLYLDQLDDAQRARFCSLAQTSDAYMRVHLVHRRRIPRPPLMNRLLTACQHFDPAVTRDQLLSWFYAPGGAAPANAPTSPGRAAVAGDAQGVA